MIINDLDLGGSHPYLAPSVGQVSGSIHAEGIETLVWPKGSMPRSQSVRFWVQAWQGIGGQAANTAGALKYLLKQLEEVASNRDQQPVYVQWTATAQGGAALNAAEAHDGWYIIDSFRPNYARFIVSGIVECTANFTQVAPQVPRSMAVSYMGGALSTNFSGQAANLVAFPLGSTTIETNPASLIRASAEGNLTLALSPTAQPEPYIPSATLANYFKGGVRVYDTINTGSNPVPTTGGTYANANWVEVRFTDHDFQGDCVITNGLILLLLQNGVTGAPFYLWNTALSPANWQLFGTFLYLLPIKSYSLMAVSPQEAAVSVWCATAGGAATTIPIRLQAGRYELRYDWVPKSGALADNNAFTPTSAGGKLPAYNSGGMYDTTVDGSAGPAPVTDYGYGAEISLDPAFPGIFGFLYQNQPTGTQPSAGSVLASGDTTSVALNARRSFGFFAIPYGVTGSYSGANLQAEAESGSLGTGWTNFADAAASAGHTAKAASGTLSGNADLFGTAFIPTAGTYDLWFRVRVASAAGSASEMTLGLWDSTSSTFVASTTFKANQATTSYTWLRACTGVTPTATHNMRYRAVTAATLGTDWFIDEAVLAPKTLVGGGASPASNGPQDIYQQFAFDRSTRIVRV